MSECIPSVISSITNLFSGGGGGGSGNAGTTKIVCINLNYKTKKNKEKNQVSNKTENNSQETTQDNGHGSLSESRVTWSCQDNDGSWIVYGEKSSTSTAKSTITSDEIERKYQKNKNKKIYFVTSQNNRYGLNFKKMVQKNQQTKKKRKIRRVAIQENDGSSSDDEEEVKWFWKHETGKWMKYGDGSFITSDELEESYQKDSHGSHHVTNAKNGDTYLINFSNMTQLNTKSNMEREIKRGDS